MLNAITKLFDIIFRFYMTKREEKKTHLNGLVTVRERLGRIDFFCGLHATLRYDGNDIQAKRDLLEKDRIEVCRDLSEIMTVFVGQPEPLRALDNIERQISRAYSAQWQYAGTVSADSECPNYFVQELVNIS